MLALARRVVSSNVTSSVPFLVVAAFACPRADAQLALEDAVIGPPGTYSVLSNVSIDLDGTDLVVAQGSGLDGVFENEFTSSLTVHRKGTSGTWLPVQSVATPPYQESDGFGRVVGVSGDSMIVAAPSRTGSVPNEGVVFVYGRAGDGTWSIVDEWRSTAPGEKLFFGWHASIDVGRAAVLDPVAQHLPHNFGPVAIFEQLADGTWARTSTIAPGPASDGLAFGWMFALDGDRLAVAAPDTTGGEVLAGRVLIHERNADGTWSVATIIDDPIGNAPTFGTTVELDGDRLFVSAPGRATVHEFQRSADGTWQVQHAFGASLPSPPGTFGASIHVADDRLAIGRSGSIFLGAGFVDLHEKAADGTWRRVATLAQDAPPSPIDTFAGAVRIVDGQALVSCRSAFTTSAISIYDLGALYHGATTVSASAGGAQVLLLRAGVDRAGDLYALLGSTSGTTPGPSDPLFTLGLPLVSDTYTDALVLGGGAGVLQPFSGALDANGAADASFTVAALTSPALVGTVLHHAYLTIDPATFAVTLASNAVRVELAP